MALPCTADNTQRKFAVAVDLKILLVMNVVLAMTGFADCSNFNGGTITWRASPTKANTATFQWKSAWEFGQGPCGTPCDYTKLNTYATSNDDHGSWTCFSGCDAQTNISTLDYWVTSFNAADSWEQGENYFTHTFTNYSHGINLAFQGDTWRSLNSVTANTWNLEVSVDLRNRSDIGIPNSSPVASVFPVIRVQHSCEEVITIPVFDPDGDVVRCRWATGSECASICSALPGATLNEEACTIHINASTAASYVPDGLYGVALMVEDFPRENITLGSNTSHTIGGALSSVPLQFLVRTPTFGNTTCSSRPTFQIPTPDSNQTISVSSEETMVLKVYASNEVDTNVRITNFVVSAPRGVMRTTIRDDDRGRSNMSYVALYWTPTEDQKGEHFICVVAEDENGKISEDKCFSVIVWAVDECSSSPCKNNGTCLNLVDRFTCICDAATTGDTCEFFTDPCSRSPCQNGGVCTNNQTSYDCQCVPGYTGIDCEVDTNECIGSPCVHGNCSDLLNAYNCTCDGGWTGSDCDQNIDECSSSPCKNNATCVDGVDSYVCQCIPGFNGTFCESEVNECNSSPCFNGGNCTDLVNDFSCSCPGDWFGKMCEKLQDPCWRSPCDTNAQCTGTPSRYKCQCPSGFEGSNCTEEITLPPPRIASDCHCNTTTFTDTWYGCTFNVNCSCLYENQQRVVYRGAQTCQRDFLPLAYAGGCGAGFGIVLATTICLCRTFSARKKSIEISETKKRTKDWAERVPTPRDNKKTKNRRPKEQSIA